MSSILEIRKHRAAFAAQREKDAAEKDLAISHVIKQICEGREWKDFPPRSQGLILSMSPAAWSAVESRVQKLEKELVAQMKATQAQGALIR